MRNKYAFTAGLLLTVALCAVLFTGVYTKRQTGEFFSGNASVPSGSAGDKKDGITVVTSFYPIYIAAINVVGDCEDISVANLSEPQTGCLHDFQMTPADMKLLSTADIFLVNGGGMESFLKDAAKQYPLLEIVETAEGLAFSDEESFVSSGNHAERFSEATAVPSGSNAESFVKKSLTSSGDHEEASSEDSFSSYGDGEEFSSETHESSDEHEENEVNAHVWMSVETYRRQVAVIAEKLCEIAEENAEELKANAAAYDMKLAELEMQQEEIREKAAGSRIISFHEAYEYVAADYGLSIAYAINLDEEQQVGAGEVADVLQAVREDGVSVIFAEELYGSDLAETVSKEADVQVYYLDTLVRGDYSRNSYIEGMQANIDTLREAFGVK